MSYTMIYHWQWLRSPKHNTTKLMVGLLPLAPYHNSVQYIHHVHLMQTGSKLGCYTIALRQSYRNMTLFQGKHIATKFYSHPTRSFPPSIKWWNSKSYHNLIYNVNFCFFWKQLVKPYSWKACTHIYYIQRVSS